MAPEILVRKGGRVPSGNEGKAADIYSFGMVMFEVCLPRVHRAYISTPYHSPQVLTGTAPFPDESDEEVVEMVTTGLRPERPSGDPSQELADELWEQIVTCWNAEPSERATALKVLRALGEAKEREEDSDEGTLVRERESMTDSPKPSAFSGQS